MRFITPAILFTALGYVHWQNGLNNGSVLLFPFIDSLLPSTAGDPAAMGRASEGLLAGLGGISLVTAIVRHRRDRVVT